MLFCDPSLKAAFIFLTRLPFRVDGKDAGIWERAIGHFPLVGAILGLGLGITANILLIFLSANVVAALVLFLSILVTGAFHEDGLADTADALGGAYERARVFEILKDSRLGTFGVVAVVISILLRVVCLAHLEDAMLWGLVLSHCLGRWPPVLLMWLLPYVSGSAGSKSRDLGRPGSKESGYATLCSLAVLVVALFLGGLHCLTALGILVVLGSLSYYLARMFKARVGGITGDFLGATEQVGEIAILLLLCVQKG